MRNPLKNAWNALLHNPKHILFAILRRVPWIIADDKLYLSLMYKFSLGKTINWDNPTTFNEKLNWLKLYDRKQEYVLMVDKIAVKDYVRQIIGEQYVIPLLYVWNNPNEINWEVLPNQFVIKTNHDGGGHGVCVVKDKKAVDKNAIMKELWDSYKRNPYIIGREWPYKMVNHKILVEEFMEDLSSGELPDYKFFCFNGQVKAVYIATERHTGDVKFDYFDQDFNHLDVVQTHPMSKYPIPKPASFELMKLLASKLSKGIPHVRVDFYEVNGKPYFGEMTFYNLGGFAPFHPDKWDKIFGDWIDLSLVNTNN